MQIDFLNFFKHATQHPIFSWMCVIFLTIDEKINKKVNLHIQKNPEVDLHLLKVYMAYNSRG